jgi:hypothetical protein
MGSIKNVLSEDGPVGPKHVASNRIYILAIFWDVLVSWM